MKSFSFPSEASMKVYITLLIKDFPIPLPPLSIDSEFERIIDITHALVDGNISYYVEFKE